MSAEQIKNEYELSKKYELDTFTFHDVTLVELSAENVAKVEAMICTDSKYRILDIQDPEKSPYWIIELGKHLGYNKDKKRELNFNTVVEKVVELIDNENGTHLTGDCSPENKKENARGQMANRITTHQHEILSYLLNPTDSKIDLIKELSSPTDPPLNRRSHLSFASKFCHYACFYIFKNEKAQDNFSIYDKFVLEALPYYLNYYGDEIVLKKNGNSHYEYKDFQKAVDAVIKASRSQISRNGFDHLLWYYFKGDRLKKEKSLKKNQNNCLLDKL